MNACACGHSVEEHPHYEACVGTVEYDGTDEPCRCVCYEEGDEG